METIRISVRGLVEFILRSGDIDNRQGGMADKEAMQIGSHLHRKIQGQMGASYRAEVSLKTEIECEEYVISVEGRADGIFTEGKGIARGMDGIFTVRTDAARGMDGVLGGVFTGQEGAAREAGGIHAGQKSTAEGMDGMFPGKDSAWSGVWIDEIKGIGRDVSKLEEAVPVHLAQAKCYAYIYAMQHELETIGVQMTYVHLESEEVRRIRYLFSVEELREWFDQLIEEYKKWASFQVKWKKIRQASIGGTVFPYPYREGQKNLAAAVYRTIARGKKLFIQAPTGVGKTIATVFPAIKAVGEGHGDKIFYLTAKTITRTVAQEAFTLLKSQGLQYKVLTLTAKEKICMCQEPDCNPDACPYAKGHFDRINDAVFELLTGWGPADGSAAGGEASASASGSVSGVETSASASGSASGVETSASASGSASGGEAAASGSASGMETSASAAAAPCIVSGINDSYTREDLIAHAEKWQVCPFELGLDLSLWVDAVICDYNYVFDPQAKLKRFFADGVKGDYIFLIDEAHNLVERGREMYSAALYKEDFLEVKRLLSPISRKAAGALERCNRQMLAWKRECETYTLLSDIGAFAIALLNVATYLETLLEDSESPLNRQRFRGADAGGPAAAADGFLSGWPESGMAGAVSAAAKLPDLPAQTDSKTLGNASGMYGTESPDLPARPDGSDTRKKVLDFYFQVRSFLSIYEEMDDGYQIYTEQEADGRFKLKLYCIHTAGKIGECLQKGRAAVLFSATLLPVRYYMELLSGTAEDYAVYAQSPFDPRKKKVLVCADVSSRYNRRGESEYRRMAEYIYLAQQARPGNYLAFFPSYKMLEDVRALFEEMHGEVRVLAQNSRMTEQQREEFLEQFAAPAGRSLVGFCVLGGIFGEGIDLKHEQLIGAVIVGTGIPQICNEREILKQYYDRHGMDGFSYAYQYPGMNRVMQSAGRVIRTDEDRGVILLLDERFCRLQYREIFPREWADFTICNLRTAKQAMTDFWRAQEDI